MSTKKLYKIPEQGIIGGVCAGLAEYFDIDVSIVRVFFIVFALIKGLGIIVYLILFLILPEHAPSADTKNTKSDIESVTQYWRKHRDIFGMSLVFIGIILIAANLLSLAIWILWPLILILFGFIILFSPLMKD